MLPICNICLRTDKKLQTLEESLEFCYDEMCDYAVEDYVQFCAECVSLLRKFQAFRKKCKLASKVLANWKKQKASMRKPLKLLSELIPSTLAPSNWKNHKIYFYQDTKLDYALPTTTDSTYTHIMTISVPTDTDKSHPFHYDTENASVNIKIEQEMSQQTDNNDYQNETVIFEVLDVKDDEIEPDANQPDTVESESSEFDVKKYVNSLEFDSDTSDEDSYKKLAEFVKMDVDSDSKKVRKKKVRHKKPLNIESLKDILVDRFDNTGEVRDEDGNIIDRDCILNSLDKMHVYTLNQIKNRVSACTVFNQEAIEVLSRVQKKYGSQYSSVFAIEHLTTKQQVEAEFLKRRSYESYISSEHKCELCYRGFKHRKMLEYHVKMYHDPSQPHYCTVCQMRFKNRHALLKHRNGHRAVYKCKLCPLVTNYRTAMVNHYHQHKGMVYTCELCKGTFKSKSCLSAHASHAHASRHACGACARCFASAAGLAQHRTRKHADEAMIVSAENRTCEECNIVFVNETVYQKHLEKSHAGKKNNSYVYKKRNYVLPRQKPNFVCRVCKITEHSIGRLTWHFKREHPSHDYDALYSDVRKHLCHVCGKGYASITDLNEHKHLHTGAKPYACDKCPKAFHRKTNLRSHMERHLPPTRECQQCGKKFVSAANLSNHMRMHIGVRHYACELCAKSFLHRSSLNAHVRGVHHHVRRARKHVLKHDQQ